MKTPDSNERLHLWLDGRMSDAERAAFEAGLEADPSLREEAKAMEKLRSLLRENAAFGREVPNADFFNSQIQEQITADQRAADRIHDHQRGAGGGWLAWLFKPWAVAGVAAAVALGIFVFRGLSVSPKTEVTASYAPNPAVTATPYYSEDAAATVLMLDGLDAFPSDREISALRVHHTERDPEFAATTLFDAGGRVLLVMNADADGRPAL
jgi:anti-sigma factor RsiW